MRNSILTLPLAALGLVLAAGTAQAKLEPYTDAPVPGVGAPSVQPSERAAPSGLRSADAGPADSTPFSSLPSGTLAGGDQVDQHTRETSPGGLQAAPNLSK